MNKQRKTPTKNRTKRSSQARNNARVGNTNEDALAVSDLPPEIEKSAIDWRYRLRKTWKSWTGTLVLSGVLATILSLVITYGIDGYGRRARTESFVNSLNSTNLADVYQSLSDVEPDSAAEKYTLILINIWKSEYHKRQSESNFSSKSDSLRNDSDFLTYDSPITEIGERPSRKLVGMLHNSFNFCYPKMESLDFPCSKFSDFTFSENGLISSFNIDSVPVSVLAIGNPAANPEESSSLAVEPAREFSIYSRGILISPDFSTSTNALIIKPEYVESAEDIIFNTREFQVQNRNEESIADARVVLPRWVGHYSESYMTATLPTSGQGFVYLCSTRTDREDIENVEKLFDLDETEEWCDWASLTLGQ